MLVLEGDLHAIQQDVYFEVYDLCLLRLPLDSKYKSLPNLPTIDILCITQLWFLNIPEYLKEPTFFIA